MSFWEDLSPGVKRYAILAAVVFAGLLLLRSCAGPESNAEPPPRGMTR